MSILLSPQMDFVFKRIFGNEKEPEILISFLNAVLNPEVKIKSVDIRNPEINKRYLEDKYSRLDILAVTDKNEIVNIEMQMSNKGDMIPRILYYLGKKYVDQLDSGEKYHKLARTISINVLSFNLLSEEEYHNVYHFSNDKSHGALTDLLEVHFIELNKIDTFDLNIPLEQWLEFVKKPDDVVERESKELPFEKASLELQKMSLSKEERELYEHRQNCLRDELSVMDAVKAMGKEIGEEIGKEIGKKIGKKIGKEIGMKIGLEQGLEQGKTDRDRELIRDAILKGTPKEMILDFLGCSEEMYLHVALELKNGES